MNFLLTEGGISGRRIITDFLYRCEHSNTHIPLIPHPHYLSSPSPFPFLPLPSFINTMRHIVLTSVAIAILILYNKVEYFLSKPLDKLLILWYNILVE